MGSFEKLGILVIVVIIVMILAVAIYQWGAPGEEPGVTVTPDLSGDPEPLVVDYVAPPGPAMRASAALADRPSATETWDGGIPKRYTIRSRDIVWKLVVERWRLKESFIEAIKKANPRLNMKRLLPGDKLTIPDPRAHLAGRRGSPERPRARIYEIQEGDRLEHIARDHLGDATRWREILELNPGLKPQNLKLGKKIRIPVK